MWQGDETKQFKDTNIVYNYKGKAYDKRIKKDEDVPDRNIYNTAYIS